MADDHSPNDAGTRLPRWDLRDLFPAPDSKEFAAALSSIEAESKTFAAKYQDKVGKLSGQQLGEAIEAYEKISQLEARVRAYADLTRAIDNEKSGWAVDVADKLRKASEQTLFFTIEINNMREGDLFEKISAPKLAHYGPWLAKTRLLREHQLSEEVEKYRRQMDPVTEDAWGRLYDQLMIDLRFKVGGKELTEGETLNIIDNDPDPKKRREAFAEFTRVLGENKKTFALVTNTLADLKSLDDRWRDYEKPDDSRHLDNQIDRETVEALAKTVRDNYSKTSHRYYAWKAKKVGVARLHPADRNAPLPGQKGREYTWDEAKEIVLAAYAKLSPELAAIGKRFFDEGWIDAAPRAGKDSGGFSHPATPDTHPYILLNFFGSAGDVMTLAHELGHGIHQVLASGQGHLKSDTPLTLAETASVFGEMITFRELLARETDLTVRRNMIAQKVEDMLNTVVRQTAFFTFEQLVHEERREKGELSSERISDLWQKTQLESLGPAVNLDVEGAQNLWMNVPHFIHTPFYVYAYAFGDCLVNALYDAYEKTPDKEDFAQKYTTLLKAGGTKRHDTAVADFGLDTNDPLFWKKGLSVIERYIDELVALDSKLEVDSKNAKTFNGAASKDAANDDKPEVTPKKPAARGPSP
ncbi:MAG: M3 family oligoendopeptidase [Alphaproteobacteria bacterium]|nr:MAG: M3 family oligoendopeptidase [Alphaproteobacteria bacterium]